MGEIDIKVLYGARSVRYYADISHTELNEYRRVTGGDEYEVQQKAEALLLKWEERWTRQKAAQTREEKKHYAADATAQAQGVLNEMAGIFRQGIENSSQLNWDELKRTSPFPKKKPNIEPPAEPLPRDVPRKPALGDAVYKAKLSFLDRLSTSRRAQKEAAAKELYERDVAAWDKAKCEAELAGVKDKREYASQVAAWEVAVKKAEVEWNTELTKFMDDQEAFNHGIEDKKAAYTRCSPDAVEYYYEIVLSRSPYPEAITRPTFSVGYNAESKVLVCECGLPAPEQIPTLKAVRYVQTRDAYEEVHCAESARNQTYDSVLYQVALRTIHEVFEADAAKAVDMVVFNGWVRAVDKATGNEVTTCVLSLQAEQAELAGINMANVDPKECFRKLRGVGSSRLHGMTAVAPILQLDKDDGRFVTAHEVVAGLDDSVNLAAIDWEEFEHLIRELFEREFSQNGGEVKVTQASRDRGVDAVAFDPDPIRGGKIVIQAKRYTNVVDVSAVRDLYGTVMNEGATKGILVTTSEYGPEAYSFAKGKPLTLLSGSNLLHLLEKHGHKARIDLQEAKRMLTEQAKTSDSGPHVL